MERPRSFALQAGPTPGRPPWNEYSFHSWGQEVARDERRQAPANAPTDVGLIEEGGGSRRKIPARLHPFLPPADANWAKKYS
jgi:hypothetical protein